MSLLAESYGERCSRPRVDASPARACVYVCVCVCMCMCVCVYVCLQYFLVVCCRDNVVALSHQHESQIHNIYILPSI